VPRESEPDATPGAEERPSIVDAPIDATLADGGPARFCVLDPDQRDAFAAFHAELSPESRYWRYFSNRRTLPEKELRRYTEPEPEQRLGVVAWIDGRLAGHACYERGSDRSQAEVAFEVADAHQGRGIGTALFEVLAREAQRHGITQFTAHVLWGNRDMLRVFRDLGFVRSTSRQGNLVRVVIDLAETERHRAAQRERAEHAARERRSRSDA